MERGLIKWLIFAGVIWVLYTVGARRSVSQTHIKRFTIVVSGYGEVEVNKRLRDHFACDPLGISSAKPWILVLLSCPLEALPKEQR